jgi:hypothetical protein
MCQAPCFGGKLRFDAVFNCGTRTIVQGVCEGAEKRSPDSWIGGRLRAIMEIGEHPLVNQWLSERGFAKQSLLVTSKLGSSFDEDVLLGARPRHFFTAN